MSDDASAEREQIADEIEVEIQDAIGAVKSSLNTLMENLHADDLETRKRAQAVYDLVTNLQRKLIRRVRMR